MDIHYLLGRVDSNALFHVFFFSFLYFQPRIITCMEYSA